MKGSCTITISNRRVHYTLTIKRNLTIICGNSATGKTTLVSLIRDYEAQGKASGIKLSCSRKCHVLNASNWQQELYIAKDTIIFIDEGHPFVNTKEFARTILNSTNYYVIITRQDLHLLPYSYEEILILKKTTSKKNMTFSKAYPKFNHLAKPLQMLAECDKILVEDSNSGFQLFSRIAQDFPETQCSSAGGKARIMMQLTKLDYKKILVIADGAAFGSEISQIMTFIKATSGHILLYLPESLEWLILKAGIIRNEHTANILAHPEEYIDSASYFSWEQFFTDLLIDLTKNSPYMRYSKQKLAAFYLQRKNLDKIVLAISDKPDRSIND